MFLLDNQDIYFYVPVKVLLYNKNKTQHVFYI